MSNQPVNTLPTQNLLVNRIYPDPNFNCRGAIEAFDVIELIRDIEKNGLQQPVVVQPIPTDLKARLPSGKFDWRLVMGHRRHKAFEVLAKTNPHFATISAIIRPDLTEIQARTMNLIENLHRKDLTVMQEARAIEKFHTAGVPQDEVAAMIGKSRGWVQVRYTALKLPPEIQAEIDAGFISQEQIKDLYGIPSKEGQFEAVRMIKERKLQGERRALKVKDPTKRKNPYEKKVRNQTEIIEMQDKIRNAIGNRDSLATRALGWAIGALSDLEIEEEIKSFAQILGKPYSIPVAEYQLVGDSK